MTPLGFSVNTFSITELVNGDIDNAVSRLAGLIRANQRDDGSWKGAWAIYFTHTIFFALDALKTVHETYKTSPQVRKAQEWLVSKQKGDGGWGEHFSSCGLREYIEHKKSLVVNT